MTETLATKQPARERWFRFAVIVLFFLTLATYLLLIDADILFAFWPDQTHYLVYAVARAHGFGRHYIAVASAPFDDVFRHSGFGAILAPVIRWRGLDIPLLKGLVVLSFFVGLGCYGNMIKRAGGGLRGWQAAVLTATAPFVLTFSQMVMADLPFVGVALIALWAFDRWTRSPRWIWLLTFLAATHLANELRIVGAALILALVLPLVRHSREGTWPATQRYAALVAFIVILLWWPVHGWLERGLDFFRLFGSEIQKIDSINHAREWSPGLMLLARVRNLPAYLSSLGLVFIPGAGNGFFAGIIGLAALSICGFGWVVCWKNKGASAHEFYLLVNLLVLLAWPYPEHRYFLPLYPLIFSYALAGANRLSERFPHRSIRHLPTMIFLVVLVCNLTMDVAEVVDFRALPAGQTRLKKLPLDSKPWLLDAPGWPSIPIDDRFRMMPMNEPRAVLIELELWCAANLAKSDIVAVAYENDFFLITGIRCGDPLRSGESLSEYQRRTGISHVIISEGLPRFSNEIIRWMKKEPERFVEVYRIAGTRTAIYRVR